MDKISNILQEIWTRRIVRFILVGVFMTLANVLLISILVNVFNLNTPLLRSLGNAFATEICLLLSFFCYRQFVWKSAQIEWRDVCLRELPKYHLSVASVIVVRVFLLFPLLDWVGIHYTLNTMIGIALGAILSYSLSDKFVFKVRR